MHGRPRGPTRALTNAMQNYTHEHQHIYGITLNIYIQIYICINSIRVPQVPAYQYHSEGLHGIRTTCGLGPGRTPLYSTMFPQVTGMAATGNFSLIRAMAAHMADEARAVHNIMGVRSQLSKKGGGLNYWGPTMNIGRGLSLRNMVLILVLIFFVVFVQMKDHNKSRHHKSSL